jgi:dolichyl-phosphate beta-glucosyltransferase
MKQQSLSIIIPVYNEQSRLAGCFSSLLKWIPNTSVSLREIVFINDGSTDSTVRILQRNISKLRKALNTNVRIISYDTNRGKGYAVKTGVLEASGEYILVMDADMSTHPQEMNKFIPHMQRGVDVIVGTRKNGHSTVVTHQPLYRELLGRFFTQLTHAIVKSAVTDYTCGFKAFSKKAAYDIFSRVTVNAWSYDVESLFIATKFGYSMIEVPVVWSDKKGSKVQLWRDAPTSLIELILIRINDMLGKYTKATHLAFINA